MRYILTVLLFACTLGVIAQVSTDEIFKHLHTDGAILVRLYTKENTINAVKGKNPELAKKIIAEQLKENKEIIDAFTKSFTLCPVYYFYSGDSKKIYNREFNGVLLNSTLVTIPEAKISDWFLIASFTGTVQSAATNDKGDVKYTDRSSEGKIYDTEVENYKSNDMDGGVDALVLFTPDFQPIDYPYPRFVRTYERLPFIARTKSRTVEIFQYKIEQYLWEKL